MIHRLRSGGPMPVLLRRDARWRTGAFIAIVGVLSAIALLLTPPAVVAYDAGEVADRAVKAPRSVSFVSESLTAGEREKAAAAVPRLYARNAAVAVNESAKLAAELAAIGRVRDLPQTREQKVAALTKLPEVALTAPTAADLADLTAPEWDTLKELDKTLVSLYAADIRPEQAELTRADAGKAIPVAWTDRTKRAATELVRLHVHANASFDPVATQLAQQAARSAVGQVQVQVTGGEVVVREGAVVTEPDVEKLLALGLSNPGIDWPGAAGLFLWALLISGVLALFLQRYAEEVWADGRRLVVVSLALLVLVSAARLVIPSHALAVYVVPYAAVAMVLTVLVGGRAALATQIAGALHVGIMSGQVELVAYVLVPGVLAIAAVRRATTAREFVTAGGLVILGNVGVITAFLLVGRSTDVLGLIQLLGAAVAGGVVAGMVAFGGTALLGHLFRITTVFELRELSDPNHPLLRQLLLRTPGTYHHSLLVGNLAERAAETIGADPLVARVGAYYHDIGKMRNPSAFIENQTGVNPHDELDPLVSAGIVGAHVRDGLALADRYHLPEAVREMIPGHHGTSLMRFFHQQALARGGPVDESAFRHAGPRPRSREAGIVMLADGTEAAVRSLEDKSTDAIRAMVEKIVAEKVADGQLDDCDLTLRDVHRIKDAFCELLLGVYHERIPYPEDRITVLRAPDGAGALPRADQRSR